MKKLFRFLLTLIVLIVAGSLIYNRFAERKLETEIDIEAPASDVWTVLMDHGAYGEWNPFIKEISGSTKVGENLKVTLQPEGQKAMTLEPVVLVNEENKEFRWKGKLYVNGIFDGVHYFLVEEVTPGQTKFVHGEEFTGLFSGPLMALMGESTEKSFNAMNAELKARAEAAYQARMVADTVPADSDQ